MTTAFTYEASELAKLKTFFQNQIDFDLFVEAYYALANQVNKLKDSHSHINSLGQIVNEVNAAIKPLVGTDEALLEDAKLVQFMQQTSTIFTPAKLAPLATQHIKAIKAANFFICFFILPLLIRAIGYALGLTKNILISQQTSSEEKALALKTPFDVLTKDAGLKLQAKYSALDTTVDSLGAEQTRLQQRNIKLTADLDQAKKDLADANTKLSTMGQSYDATVTKLSAEVQQLKTAEKTLQTELSGLKTQSITDKTTIGQHDKTIAELRTKLQTLESTQQTLQGKLLTAENENTALKAKQVILDQKLIASSTLEAQIADLNKQLGTVRSQLHIKTQREEQLQNQITDSATLLKNTQDELNKLKRENKALRKQLGIAEDKVIEQAVPVTFYPQADEQDNFLRGDEAPLPSVIDIITTKKSNEHGKNPLVIEQPTISNEANFLDEFSSPYALEVTSPSQPSILDIITSRKDTENKKPKVKSAAAKQVQQEPTFFLDGEVNEHFTAEEDLEKPRLTEDELQARMKLSIVASGMGFFKEVPKAPETPVAQVAAAATADLDESGYSSESESSDEEVAQKPGGLWGLVSRFI